MAATLENSLSGVTATDWTRNLSRHLASSGGSSFIAWSRTTGSHQYLRLNMDWAIVFTLDFYILSHFNTSRIGPNTISGYEVSRASSALTRNSMSYCFGAVVLT